MTSQVAIFNQRGVAVASDTVTTISSAGGTKTMNNAEKIWPLGSDHLVVVAMSGSVHINWVDSRVLVAEWTRTLTRPLATVNEYATSFAAWLDSEPKLIHADSDITVAKSCIEDHLQTVYGRVTDEVRKNDLDDDEVSDLLYSVAQEGLKYLKSLPKYTSNSDKSDARYLAESGFDLDGLLESEFGDFPGFDRVKSILAKSSVLAISRRQPMPIDTTVAFIGFGYEEHFANLIRTEFRGRYGGLTRLFIGEPFGSSSDDDGGSISTLAQSEAIHGFLRGVQPDVYDLFLEHLSDCVIEQFDDRDSGVKTAKGVVDLLNERVFRDIKEHFINPMLDTIDSLSLRDLAHLATALVGIQAMRANASPRPPGVGGLVESLVIDRAEGVRWIERLPR